MAGEVVSPSRPGRGAASPGRTGTVDELGSRAATTVILMPVTRPLDAGGVAVDATSTRGSRPIESICAGRITDTAMVITVMATPAIPSATRGLDGSYVPGPSGLAPETPIKGVFFSLFKKLIIFIIPPTTNVLL